MARLWSEKQSEDLRRLVGEGKDTAQLAKMFGLSGDAIYQKMKRMGLVIPRSEALRNLTPEELVKHRKERDEISVLRKNENGLIDRIRYLEAELGARCAIVGDKTIREIKTKRPGKIHATAFIVASDWHAEETVKAEGVNYYNEFNLDIADRRIARYFNNAVALVEMKAKDTILDGVVFAILGDMISGNIHEELLSSCSLPPIKAARWVQQRLAGGIRMLKAKCDELGIRLTIVGKVGNHPRITKKIHVAHEQGNNLEWYMYGNLSDMFPDVNWVLEENYLTYLDLYGYSVRLHHGWAINYQGGIGGVMIAMNKANAAWDRGRKAHINICGHWHTQLTAYSTIINGSLIGYSPYSVRIKATPEPAQQKFFLLTSGGRVTGEYSIFLDESEHSEAQKTARNCAA